MVTVTSNEPVGASDARPGDVADDVARPPASRKLMVAWGVGLLAIYWVLSLALSPHAYLSSDIGGKTAALANMQTQGEWSTDLGYWAEFADPNGDVYPAASVSTTEEGWWVITTSLPMVLAARPLWNLGGAQLILLLPMLSAAGAALVAGRIQSHYDGSSGAASTFAVGLATPLTVYALDFWEHAPGVFFMALGVWGTILALEHHRVRSGVLAGFGFGFAATMRQEALVYGFCAGVVLVGLSLMAARRGGPSVKRALAPCFAMATSTIAVLAASIAGEIWFYGEPLRSTRSVQAAAATTNGISDRLAAGLTTLLSPINAVHPVAILLGLVLLVGLVSLASAVDRGESIRIPAIISGIVGVALVARFARFGPSFVPGLVPTTSLAVAGAFFGVRDQRLRVPAALAMLPLPIVFLTQYAAGAAPQWGGRYLLLTGYLLTVVACIVLRESHQQFFRALLGLGVIITAAGVWHASERTRMVEADFDLIAEVADGDIVVWFDPTVAGEGGVDLITSRWLTTFGGGRTELVLDVLDAADADRFVFVDRTDNNDPSFEGFVATSDVGAWETSPVILQRLTVFERR